MYPNPLFQKTETRRALDFARQRGFGVLAASTAGAPILSHAPFLLAEEGSRADMHLLRSNPICKAAGPVTLMVYGPDGYVSPDWYELDDQVPTWNYTTVHLTGRLESLPDGALRDLIDRQSAFYEDQIWDKTPWTTDKMTPEVLARLMRMIVPMRLHIDDVQSVFKLNQNKPDAARLKAADQITHGLGLDLGELAGLMRQPPDADAP